jgi:hypothetical protein
LPPTFCSAHSVLNQTLAACALVNQKSAHKFVAPAATTTLGFADGSVETGLFVRHTKFTEIDRGLFTPDTQNNTPATTHKTPIKISTRFRDIFA